MSSEGGEESEALSEVFEEEEDTSIKKVYVSRAILPVSKKIDQKQLADDSDAAIDDDRSSVQEVPEASEAAEHEPSTAAGQKRGQSFPPAPGHGDSRRRRKQKQYVSGGFQARQEAYTRQVKRDKEVLVG